MVITEVASVSAGPVRGERRGADRRRGLAALLATMAEGLAVGQSALTRERFQDELRALVRARSATLVDDPGAVPAVQGTCFEVPWRAVPGARLELVFEPGRTLDGWTCQVLESATHLAALILEVERAQGRLSGSVRARADGAAPLIGSSQAIRQVRQRIERVAATDFTVLIEGPIAR